MAIKRVGHIVLRSRDLAKARSFYVDFLGMKVGNEDPERGMFLRFNDYHHDIAIFKAQDDTVPGPKQAPLEHVALICDDDKTVKDFYVKAKAAGVEITGWTDHDITHSLYLKDFEGNTIEIYADAPYDWKSGGMGFRSKQFDIEAVAGSK